MEEVDLTLSAFIADTFKEKDIQFALEIIKKNKGKARKVEKCKT